MGDDMVWYQVPYQVVPREKEGDCKRHEANAQKISSISKNIWEGTYHCCQQKSVIRIL